MKWIVRNATNCPKFGGSSLRMSVAVDDTTEHIANALRGQLEEVPADRSRSSLESSSPCFIDACRHAVQGILELGPERLAMHGIVGMRVSVDSIYEAASPRA